MHWVNEPRNVSAVLSQGSPRGAEASLAPTSRVIRSASSLPSVVFITASLTLVLDMIPPPPMPLLTTFRPLISATYGTYLDTLSNDLIFRYVCNNAGKFRVDIELLKSFVRKMQTLDSDITTHNTNYVDEILKREKDYFDNILKDIDPNIKLDEEQRRAVVTDDDYCLLVAGAGAGKTTTMAAKVKYLVEKKGIAPEDIIVISYTNKAIGELKERINDGLKIPAKICTFHAFAFEIVKKFSVEPPEINFSSFKIVFEMMK